MDPASLGRAGEQAADAFYRNNGYDVIDRNWRCNEGEVDLVVARGDLVVFCEVKTRRSRGYGGPAAAVSHSKQRRLRRVAAAWLSAHRGSGRSRIRFDVAAVHPVAGCWTVDVIESAF